MKLITKTLAFILIFLNTSKVTAQVDSERLSLLFAEGYKIDELVFLMDNMPIKKHEKWMEKRGYTFREEVPSKKCLVYKKGEVVSLYIFYNNDYISEIQVTSSPQKYYQAVDTFAKSTLFRPTKTLKKLSVVDKENYKYWRSNGFIYFADAEDYRVGIFRDYPVEMERKISKSYLPQMVYVKGGSFTMGSKNEEDPSDTKPAFSVIVGDFNIGQYEVTVKQYRYFCTETKRKMPSAPLSGWQEDYPIRNISWDDAIDYCHWLSYVSGKRYRLPSEAEWEYAARGGQKTKNFIYAGSDFLEKVGWTFKRNEVVMKRIGSLYPNELEIYDMSSNVFEWTNDWYSSTWYETKSKNLVLGAKYKGSSLGTQKVIRGGSASESSKSKIIYRGKVSPSANFVDLGFRVVLEED